MDTVIGVDVAKKALETLRTTFPYWENTSIVKVDEYLHWEYFNIAIFLDASKSSDIEYDGGETGL